MRVPRRLDDDEYEVKTRVTWFPTDGWHSNELDERKVTLTRHAPPREHQPHSLMSPGSPPLEETHTTNTFVLSPFFVNPLSPNSIWVLPSPTQ